MIGPLLANDSPVSPQYVYFCIVLLGIIGFAALGSFVCLIVWFWRPPAFSSFVGRKRMPSDGANLASNGRELTPEDATAINKSEAQIDRGEYVDFDTSAAETGKKYRDE